MIASMGTDADAKPGDESSAHPGEEEADEPANDSQTDVVSGFRDFREATTFGCVGKDLHRLRGCQCVFVLR